jgi:hypothetical protein
MPRHQDKDLSFETPDGWVDRTIVAYASPTDEQGREAAPNFVMTREQMREGDSLRSHADRQLLELGRHLKDFDLLESKETQLGGQPAIFLRYTWMGHFGRLLQTVTIVERQHPERGRVAASFTTTAKSDEALRTNAIFNEILKSVKFDGGDGAPPPPPRSSGPESGGRGSIDAGAPVVPMPGFRGGRR